MRRFLVRYGILALMGATLATGCSDTALAQGAGLPAAILLIRHAEKPAPGSIDLSPTGFERAKLLPQLFNDGAAAQHPVLPKPDFLFATHVTSRSNRPVETITPLADTLKLSIDSRFEEDDWSSLAKELLSGRYAGKVVLVAWHHGTMPELAAGLGVSPVPGRWPDAQFDRVWRIEYRAGKADFADLPQELMAGDSK